MNKLHAILTVIPLHSPKNSTNRVSFCNLISRIPKRNDSSRFDYSAPSFSLNSGTKLLQFTKHQNLNSVCNINQQLVSSYIFPKIQRTEDQHSDKLAEQLPATHNSSAAWNINRRNERAEGWLRMHFSRSALRPAAGVRYLSAVELVVHSKASERFDFSLGLD